MAAARAPVEREDARLALEQVAGAHPRRQVGAAAGGTVEPAALAWWETGARYHQLHALALLGVAAHPAQPPWAGWLFLAGITLFSGSLYVMTLTGARWLGAGRCRFPSGRSPTSAARCSARWGAGGESGHAA